MAYNEKTTYDSFWISMSLKKVSPQAFLQVNEVQCRHHYYFVDVQMVFDFYLKRNSCGVIKFTVWTSMEPVIVFALTSLIFKEI